VGPRGVLHPFYLIANFLSLDVNNPKFRKLVGKDAKPETMEEELERVSA